MALAVDPVAFRFPLPNCIKFPGWWADFLMQFGLCLSRRCGDDLRQADVGR